MKRGFILFWCLMIIFCFTVKAQQTQRVYLSGTGNDNTIKWDFFCSAGMNAGKWTTIPVPSNWELQGFGKYDYGFAKDSTRGKEYGLYKHTFKADQNWKNKITSIVFEGSMTDTEVKINGKLAGEIHQGAFYVFRYDISKLLKYGEENLLEVKVDKHSANQSVNEAERKADFWIFGGIFRPVYLEVSPIQQINRIQIDAKANGQFKAILNASGNIDKIGVQLASVNGKTFGEPIFVQVKAGINTDFLIEHQFANPKLWSSEFPNLYVATFTLYVNNKAVNTISKRIGFRTIQVKERDGVYIKWR
jgi:beta-galactosidase/beta-glucuronidase